MEDLGIPCFTSVLVKPDEVVRVEVPEGTIWQITGVSIAPADNLPSEGRVVLYASAITDGDQKDEKVAIAPLRIGVCEVVTVNYTINCVTIMEFSTSGAEVAVTVNGTLSSSTQLKVTTSSKQ